MALLLSACRVVIGVKPRVKMTNVSLSGYMNTQLDKAATILIDTTDKVYLQDIYVFDINFNASPNAAT